MLGVAVVLLLLQIELVFITFTSPPGPCGQFIYFVLVTSRLLHYHYILNNQPILLTIIVILITSLPYILNNQPLFTIHYSLFTIHYCYQSITIIIIIIIIIIITWILIYYYLKLTTVRAGTCFFIHNLHEYWFFWRRKNTTRASFIFILNWNGINNAVCWSEINTYGSWNFFFFEKWNLNNAYAQLKINTWVQKY